MIITRNGKDYLVVTLYNKNGKLDCSEYFIEAQKILRQRKFKEEYGNTLFYTTERFSGNYFSPSFLKSYMTNPALAFYSMFVRDDDVNAPHMIGITVHKILELFYKGKERSKEEIYKLLDSCLMEGQNRNQVKYYIDKYINIPDYLNGSKLNHSELKCQCEYKGKVDVYIPKFNIDLPCKVSFVVDRLDYRDDEYYLIDYKTGRPRESATGWDGHLTSMILYKWAIEHLLNIDIHKGFLCTPGNSYKWMEIDYSLENEVRALEIVFEFYNKLKEDLKTYTFDYTNEGFFSTPQLKEFRKKMKAGKDIILEVELGDTKK